MGCPGRQLRRRGNLLLPGALRGCFAPGERKMGLPGANWGVFAPGGRVPGTKWAAGVPGKRKIGVPGTNQASSVPGGPSSACRFRALVVSGQLRRGSGGNLGRFCWILTKIVGFLREKGRGGGVFAAEMTGKSVPIGPIISIFSVPTLCRASDFFYLCACQAGNWP